MGRACFWWLKFSSCAQMEIQSQLVRYTSRTDTVSIGHKMGAGHKSHLWTRFNRLWYVTDQNLRPAPGSQEAKQQNQKQQHFMDCHSNCVTPKKNISVTCHVSAASVNQCFIMLGVLWLKVKKIPKIGICRMSASGERDFICHLHSFVHVLLQACKSVGWCMHTQTTWGHKRPPAPRA